MSRLKKSIEVLSAASKMEYKGKHCILYSRGFLVSKGSSITLPPLCLLQTETDGNSVRFAIARNEFCVPVLHWFDEDATPIEISLHVKCIGKKFAVVRSAFDKKNRSSSIVT